MCSVCCARTACPCPRLSRKAGAKRKWCSGRHHLQFGRKWRHDRNDVSDHPINCWIQKAKLYQHRHRIWIYRSEHAVFSTSSSTSHHLSPPEDRRATQRLDSAAGRLEWSASSEFASRSTLNLRAKACNGHHPSSNGLQPKSNGHPSSDGLHPSSDGLQPKSNGHPSSDGLHPSSDGLQPTSTMASNLRAMASNLRAMATLVVMASILVAMASNLLAQWPPT